MGMMIFVVAGANVSSNLLLVNLLLHQKEKELLLQWVQGHHHQGEAVLQQIVEHHSENFIFFCIGLILSIIALIVINVTAINDNVYHKLFVIAIICVVISVIISLSLYSDGGWLRYCSFAFLISGAYVIYNIVCRCFYSNQNNEDDLSGLRQIIVLLGRDMDCIITITVNVTRNRVGRARSPCAVGRNVQ